MFNIFKKNKFTQADIDKVLNQFDLYGQPLSNYVVASEIVDGVVNLSLKIHKDADQKKLEEIYYALRTRLCDMGVDETNLNVVLSDEPTKNTPITKTFVPNAQKNESAPIKRAPTQSDIAPHPRIHHIIAVASGKGGVGKSTTTVNIAIALQRLGKKVGILDADIYGPSMPDMLGVAGIKPKVENDQFVPIEADGLAMLSIGNLIQSDDTPIAWRGIKATGALMQMYQQTNWPNLDYLMIDMPPGTGDITLTLAQRIAVTGAIVVTTPQHIALLDAKKGVEMFRKVNIPVLGIVENMALHICSQCGHQDFIFGADGGKEMASLYGVPLLGQLPIDAQIRLQMDKGMPKGIHKDIAQIYDDIAKNIDDNIAQFAKTRNDGRIF